jgi:hypothetical protein
LGQLINDDPSEIKEKIMDSLTRCGAKQEDALIFTRAFLNVQKNAVATAARRASMFAGSSEAARIAQDILAHSEKF